MPATRKIIVIGDLHNYPGTCFRIYFAYTIQRRYVKQDVLHPYLCYILIIPTVTSQRTYYIHTYAVLLLYLQRPQTRLTTYLPMLYSYHTYKDLNPDLLPTYIHTFAVLLSYLQRPQTRLTIYLPMLYSYHTYKDLKPDLLPTYLPMLYSYHTTKTSTSKHRWLELEPQNLLKGRESFA